MNESFENDSSFGGLRKSAIILCVGNCCNKNIERTL